MKKFLWGALIGAGIALLYAPATGRRTRSMIRDKAVKLSNDTTDFVESKRQHLSNKMEGYKAKARQVANRMSERVAQAGSSMDREGMNTGPSI